MADMDCLGRLDPSGAFPVETFASPTTDMKVA